MGVPGNGRERWTVSEQHLFHRLVDGHFEPRFGLCEDEAVAVENLDRPVALPRKAGAGGQRLDQVALKSYLTVKKQGSKVWG